MLPIARLAPWLLAAPLLGQVPLVSLSGDPGVLGAAVALDGGLAAVGDPLADLVAVDGGLVRLIDAETGHTLHTLVPNDGYAGQRFGFRVALGDRLVLVGAPFDDTQGLNSGAAYVFDAASGVQLAKLLAPVGGAGDQFGQGLALSAGRAIVGALAADGLTTNAGAAHVFEAASGAFEGTLLAPDGQPQDRFGSAIAAEGGLVVVGARQHDQGGTESGTTYLFDLPTGAFLAEMSPSDSSAGQHFGAAIAMDSDHIVVGAIQDLAPSGSEGSMYVFDRAGVQLHKLVPDVPAAMALFGQGLDLSEGKALVGASHQSGNDGAVYLFDVVAGTQLYTYRSPVSSPGSLYGVSLGLEGDRAVIGAPGNFGTGAVDVLLPEAPIGTQECPGVPNSRGLPGELQAVGSAASQSNEVWLVARNLPAGQFGFFITGQMPGLVMGPGGSQGNLCITGSLARFNAVIPNSGIGGFFEQRIDTGQIPTQPASAIQPGETWYYQAWYRDQNPQPTSNFTSAAGVLYR